MKDPKLRTVEKYEPPYHLNKFPPKFALKLGQRIVYHLVTRDNRLEGPDWEQIFAWVIDAEWKPSNVGLDDVVLEQCAWGAKTVKNKRPAKAQSIRLISGRNAPSYSYNVRNLEQSNPNEIGEMVLGIWNERVSGVKKRYKHLRTVVLIKSDDLRELAVFEFDTIRFEPEDYEWKWNKNNNLEGFSKEGTHRFTWQPHGSQFTTVEQVPADRLALRIHCPPDFKQNFEETLKSVNFEDSWVEII